MSTGYSWEGIREEHVTLFGARHVPECLCGGLCLLGALNQLIKCSTFTFILLTAMNHDELQDYQTTITLCGPIWYLAQLRYTLCHLIAICSYLLVLSANSLFICLVNLFVFILLTHNTD